MTRQQIECRLIELEALRLERVDRAGVECEEDVPDDAEGQAICAEWNALVAALKII